MRQFVLECLVDLPDDVFDQVEIIAQMKSPWVAMLKSLEDNGVKFQEKSEVIEPRSKAVVPAGAKRGRKPKAFVLQPLVSTPSAVAAE